MRIDLLLACLAVAAGCDHSPTAAGQGHELVIPPSPAPPVVPVVLPPAGEPESDEIPAYLQRDPELRSRKGEEIVDATLSDNDVAKRYARWKPKGARTPSGDRITILTAKLTYSVGEAIRVVHVYEATKPGITVHVMGPKPIDGETIDGVLVTPARESRPYSGLVLESPEADFNYGVTEYRLAAGRHVIRWTPDALLGASPGLTSNEIVIEIK